MIVRPYSINERNLVFYQAQFNSYHVLGDTRQSLNYGVGKRFLSEDESYFWGLNSFLDLDKEMNSRVSLGSELKAANFNFVGNYYLDAIDELKRFIKIYPNNERINFAYYLLAMSYYEQIHNITRSNTSTFYVWRFPNRRFGEA